MRHHDTDDDEPRTVTVPLQFMDSTQRAIYNATQDGTIKQLRQLRDQAYRDREHADSVAYIGGKKYCPSCGYDLTDGDDLTRAGGDEVDDAALSDPHSKNFNLDAAKAVRAQLYADIEAEQRDAWKKDKL